MRKKNETRKCTCWVGQQYSPVIVLWWVMWNKGENNENVESVKKKKCCVYKAALWWNTVQSCTVSKRHVVWQGNKWLSYVIAWVQFSLRGHKHCSVDVSCDAGNNRWDGLKCAGVRVSWMQCPLLPSGYFMQRQVYGSEFLRSVHTVCVCVCVCVLCGS